MRKFKFLIKYGLKKRVFRKAFLIANIIIAILTIAIINLPTIIGLFSKDEEVEPVTVYVINEIGEATLIDDLSALINPDPENIGFIVESLDASEFNVESFWEDDTKDVVFHFKGTVESSTIDSFAKNPNDTQMVFSAVQYLLISYQIDYYVPPQFSELVLPQDYESEEEQMGLSSITTILVLPFFLLIRMATQFVGVDIIEEKSTKAIETIISSVPAKIHFLSKIVSAILFVMIQGILAVIYGSLGALIGGLSKTTGVVNLPSGRSSLLSYLGEIMPNWPVVLSMSLLFMVFGTLVYLVIAALFASMAVTQEDYQQFQSPLMITLLVAFYIGIFAPLANGFGFMKVMAFVPIFTPILAPIAFASGVIVLWEALLALFIVILFLVGLLYVVAPVYRVAILSYDQTKLIQRIKSNFKKGFVKQTKEV